MHISDFKRRVTEPLTQKLPSFDGTRCDSSYSDLLALDRHARSVEASAPSTPFFDAAAAGDDATVALHQQVQEALVVLLKAEYFFAAAAVDSLFASVCAQPTLTMKRFLNAKSHAPLAALSLPDALPAYTVCMFRHKFVAHPEFSRIMISEHSPTDGVRLIPSRHDGQATFSAHHRVELAKLTAKHLPGIPGLSGNVNPYEQVSLLFYGIPLPPLGTPDADRTLVDELAEHTLCTSLRRSALVPAFDMLAAAVVRAVP